MAMGKPLIGYPQFGAWISAASWISSFQHLLKIWGFLKIRGTLLGGPYDIVLGGL